ncbi:glycoside hydrolase family 44 protein, partial [Candidatus Acetothermia bacterium]|nr:glycoside hydrolase family 44 protein [Candidatus Acetothermia bacterium]
MGLQLTHVGDTSSLGRNSGPNILVPTAAPGPTLQISPQLDRHAISPYIYGMNFADETFAQELKLPVNRFGGNATTRYNWQNDTSNHASDWYFENIPEANSNPGALPNESTTDRFVDQDRRTQTQTIMTLPLIGWTPKSRAIACGFSVAKYGAQQSTDPWQPDCGNGVHTNGSEITGNDPLDTSTAIDPTFVQEWINHLILRYNTAAQGGVKFYDLDNEPALWNSTHRDVHPTPVSYDELRDRTHQYAPAIKVTDPTAATLGPVAWGWVEYFYSAKDVADGGAWWNTRSDRRAHGDVPLTDWYLQQMKLYEQQHGTRILDYLDLHYYPQALGVTLSPAG